MLISYLKENAILRDKRLKDNSNKAKTKKAMAPLLASQAKFSPCDVSHEVQQVELRATCCRDKFCQISCYASEKVPVHREDVSLQHVPKTSPGTFFTSVPTLQFGPCYMSLLHSPATCPVIVYLTQFCPSFILQQHVPANVSSRGPTLRQFYGLLSEGLWSDSKH